jgi:iron only hydrogenase large subunit-like protein
LLGKATAELLDRGQSAENASRQLQELRDLLGGVVMIGTKKLSTIREDIEEALASAGDDPIQRLERLIASAERKGDSTDVMEDLKRFLESTRKPKHRKHRVEAKPRAGR